MFDIITIGGATRDITFFTDKGKVIETPEDMTAQRLLAFEYGAKIRSEEVRMNFGGGACNAAATFAKMELGVGVISRIGNDGNGKSILGNLHNRGIVTDLIQIDEGQHSAFSFIVMDSASDGGERVIFTHKGAANGLEIHPEEIKDTKWVYLTSLGDNFEDSLCKIGEAVQVRDIKLAWNPGETEVASGKERLADFMKFTYLLIINKDEAIELAKSDIASGLANEDFNDIIKLIRIIKSWGAANVVITDGKNGACLLAGEEIFKASAFAKQQADTTGAGDAFGSGLVAGYIISGDFEMALKYAVLNSGGEVTEYGAESGIMTREEIEGKMGEIQIERVK